MLFFYLRLATERHFRIICHLSIAYITLSSTAILLVNLFGCAPISGSWDRRPSTHSVCITTPLFYYVAETNNAFTDLLLIVLPIPILVRLQLEWRVKLGLVAMFTMGFLWVRYFLSARGMLIWKQRYGGIRSCDMDDVRLD